MVSLILVILQDEWYLYSITVITCLWLYCISITKMSDTCTLSQLSLMSLTVLYQYHQDETVIEYRYPSSRWYWYSTVRDIGDNCDSVQLSFILVIRTLSQLSPMSLTVLYQYHQDEWYLYSITVITYVSDCTVSVSPRWVIPVLYQYSQRQVITVIE
jgi:hypothetical protein